MKNLHELVQTIFFLQMGMGYNLTRNDLVKKLRVAALRAMS